MQKNEKCSNLLRTLTSRPPCSKSLDLPLDFRCCLSCFEFMASTLSFAVVAMQSSAWILFKLALLAVVDSPICANEISVLSVIVLEIFAFPVWRPDCYFRKCRIYLCKHSSSLPWSKTLRLPLWKHSAGWVNQSINQSINQLKVICNARSVVHRAARIWGAGNRQWQDATNSYWKGGTWGVFWKYFMCLIPG